MDMRIGSLPLPDGRSWRDRVRSISSGGDLLKIVRRRVALILACIVVVLGATAAYVYTATPRYTAQLELLLETSGRSMFDIGSAIAGQLQDEAMIVSEIGVIKSRSLAKRVIEKLDLAQDSE